MWGLSAGPIEREAYRRKRTLRRLARLAVRVIGKRALLCDCAGEQRKRNQEQIHREPRALDESEHRLMRGCLLLQQSRSGLEVADGNGQRVSHVVRFRRLLQL